MVCEGCGKTDCKCKTCTERNRDCDCSMTCAGGADLYFACLEYRMGIIVDDEIKQKLRAMMQKEIN